MVKFPGKQHILKASMSITFLPKLIGDIILMFIVESSFFID